MHSLDAFHVRRDLLSLVFFALTSGNTSTRNWHLNVCCHIVSTHHRNTIKNMLVFVILQTFTIARRANVAFVADCDWNELVFQVSAFENFLRPARWTLIFALLTQNNFSSMAF